MPYLPSPGRCIYCPCTENLTDEHIVPLSLGGRLILEEATCETCRDHTHAIESVVTRQMYWPLRLRLGIRGSRKHKKERPTHWHGILRKEDKIDQMLIEIGKYPLQYTVLVMPPPGFVAGRPPSNRLPEVRVVYKGDPLETEVLARELGVTQMQFEHTMHPGTFLRMIAKICHAYAVSIVGLKGVDFYLPPIIRRESDCVDYYIGGAVNPADELEPPNDLALSIRELRGVPHLVAHTTILGQKRFPTYEAIIGQIIDVDSVRTKMDCAQPR